MTPSLCTLCAVRFRAPLTLLLALIAAVAVAACGSASSSSHAQTSTHASAAAQTCTAGSLVDTSSRSGYNTQGLHTCSGIVLVFFRVSAVDYVSNTIDSKTRLCNVCGDDELPTAEELAAVERASEIESPGVKLMQDNDVESAKSDTFTTSAFAKSDPELVAKLDGMAEQTTDIINPRMPHEFEGGLEYNAKCRIDGCGKTARAAVHAASRSGLEDRSWRPKLPACFSGVLLECRTLHEFLVREQAPCSPPTPVFWPSARRPLPAG